MPEQWIAFRSALCDCKSVNKFSLSFCIQMKHVVNKSYIWLIHINMYVFFVVMFLGKKNIHMNKKVLKRKSCYRQYQGVNIAGLGSPLVWGLDS